MNIPYYVIFTIVPLFYIVLPLVLLLCVKNTKALKITTIIFAVVFFAILFMATTFKVTYLNNCINVVFEYSGKFGGKPINLDLLPMGKKDFLINIFMLIPVGSIICVFTPDIFWKRLLVSLFVGALIGVGIESTQYFLPVARNIQLSDVILNTLSVILGTITFHLVWLFKRKMQQR